MTRPSSTLNLTDSLTSGVNERPSRITASLVYSSARSNPRRARLAPGLVLMRTPRMTSVPLGVSTWKDAASRGDSVPSSARLATSLEKTIRSPTVALTETTRGSEQSASGVLSVILGIGPRSGATSVASSILRLSDLPPEGSGFISSESTYTVLPPIRRGPTRAVALSTAASPSRVGWKSAAVGAEPSSLTTGSGKISCTPPSTQLDSKVTPHASAGSSGLNESVPNNPRVSAARSIAAWSW
eukprot:scaffold55543_cov66-Phaeocystis_antarctica.AAC.1